MNEGGAGHHQTYGPFYGRGYMQLTWAGNYRSYGKYKNLNDHRGPYGDTRITTTSTHAIDSGGNTLQWAPRYDPAIISSDLHHAGESSGYYWVTKHFRGKSNINRVADLPFSLTAVAFICWLVNGGTNGYLNRLQFSKYLENILFDHDTKHGIIQFDYPPLAPSSNPSLCAHFPPVEIAFTLHSDVNYERQNP